MLPPALVCAAFPFSHTAGLQNTGAWGLEFLLSPIEDPREIPEAEHSSPTLPFLSLWNLFSWEIDELKRRWVVKTYLSHQGSVRNSPWGHKESDTTNTFTSLRPGEAVMSGSWGIFPHLSWAGAAACTAAAAAKSLQSCPTLWHPIEGSPPGFPVPGILQARTLEWVAISFSSAWKWSR